MRTSLHMLKRGMFNLIEGDFISRYAQAYGEWSDLEVRFLLNNLRADSNVVEVGSNIGMHAIPIARHIELGKLLDLLRKYPEDLQFPNEIRKPNPKKRQGIQTAHRCNARPFS